jgi:hypothetical protein
MIFGMSNDIACLPPLGCFIPLSFYWGGGEEQLNSFRWQSCILTKKIHLTCHHHHFPPKKKHFDPLLRVKRPDFSLARVFISRARAQSVRLCFFSVCGAFFLRATVAAVPMIFSSSSSSVIEECDPQLCRHSLVRVAVVEMNGTGLFCGRDWLSSTSSSHFCWWDRTRTLIPFLANDS